ncbi:MarR family transcriptional regulator [Streptomyces arenae]|uniref:MarR family transcriptional regulator n=1 Tax=Streptomyces arenae TaxID=29301 RepID=UPI002658EC74|nr:helix-turn-helix domain-containing protein [Streptomyces arenae]MCG7206511.1 MarR family transcriptional regulator [Streptomyces arenae]
MNVIDLYLLGHRLQKLAEAAVPADGIGEHPTSTGTVLIVAADLRDHPGTTVTEIARRTGLAQSQVSNCVARLRSAGAAVAEPDPRDGRRTLLSPAAEPSDRMRAVRETPLGPALAAATSDPDEALALLERLSSLLLQEAPRRSR